MLRARKHLLRWLHLLLALDGLAALDLTSEPVLVAGDARRRARARRRPRRRGALHDPRRLRRARGGAGAVYWLHTHGLEALGAFDSTSLRPSPCAGAARRRSAAGAGLCRARRLDHADDHRASTSATRAASSTLVPADDLRRLAPPPRTPACAIARRRSHAGRRAVVCEPRGLFGLPAPKPIPSRFLSNARRTSSSSTSPARPRRADGGTRARQTLGVFKGLIAEFGPPACPTA